MVFIKTQRFLPIHYYYFIVALFRRVTLNIYIRKEVENMGDTQGRGSNLTDEDRAKGGQHSHQSQSGSGDSSSSSGMKGGSSSGQGRGNFGNHEEHVRAGEQSSGHTGDPEEHSRAGKIGGSK